MSDRTFRLIFDGKKGGLIKGSTPSSAAKKAYKKLSADLGKTSFKFELQETTKDSKKKVYGPYKGNFVKDKIKVKMVGGSGSGSNSNNNTYNNVNNVNNVKNIINLDDNKLLYLLLSTNNNNNKKYFNQDKYNRLIAFLSKFYSFEDQLKKLLSLRNKSYLSNINSNINYQKIFDKMREMLHKNILEIKEKLKDKRTVASAAARTAASAASKADANVEEAVGKKELLERFLNNNAKLKK
jgi:hypothetical protein